MTLLIIDYKYIDNRMMTKVTRLVVERVMP